MSYNREVIFSFEQKIMSCSLMLGRDLEGLLMNENMALDIG
jgi:hypothetical protein